MNAFNAFTEELWFHGLTLNSSFLATYIVVLTSTRTNKTLTYAAILKALFLLAFEVQKRGKNDCTSSGLLNPFLRPFHTRIIEFLMLFNNKKRLLTEYIMTEIYTRLSLITRKLQKEEGKRSDNLTQSPIFLFWC